MVTARGHAFLSAWFPVRVASAVVLAVICAACASPSYRDTGPLPAGDQAILRGWRHCTDDSCGKNIIAAYSQFVFLRVDDGLRGRVPELTLAPGPHWVEAHYAWGMGVIVGIGNWRNYAFEVDVLPGHVYSIEEAPAGCIVPASKRWVSWTTLRLNDVTSSSRSVREIRALEFCAPGSEEMGSCRRDSDCKAARCVPFGGSTGYGVCGELRD